MTYLVTAATGNIGSAVLRALLERGERVRAVSRSERDWPAGVEGVVGDLDDPDGLEDAAAGVRGVFLMSGYPSEASLLDALPSQARVVLLSSGSVPGGSRQNAVTRYHAESEQAVKASGRPWTMLQPDSFMTNALRWKPQLDAGDTVKLPFAGVPIALIDPADLGAVAAAALIDDRHAERSYRLSGPEALLPESQVAILAAGLARRLVFEPQIQRRGPAAAASTDARRLRRRVLCVLRRRHARRDNRLAHRGGGPRATAGDVRRVGSPERSLLLRPTDAHWDHRRAIGQTVGRTLGEGESRARDLA